MAKKRKIDQVESDTVPEQPPQGPNKDASVGSPSQVADIKNPAKKSKGQSRQERSERRSTKKRKTKDHSHAPTQEPDGAADLSNAIETTAEDEQEGADVSQPVEEQAAASKKSKKEKKAADKEQTKAAARFIVFVGNLPYDATAEQIRQHFIKIAPTSVRLSADKKTGRGKGFAFLEFDAYDKMKTCLKLYHHSIFDPPLETGDGEAQDKRQRGRKINVELTAGGGGGKSKDRKAKIKTKNEKLEEERARLRLKEKAEKDKAGHKKKEAPGTGANAAQSSETGNGDHAAIHPSRLSRMQH